MAAHYCMMEPAEVPNLVHSNAYKTNMFCAMNSTGSTLTKLWLIYITLADVQDCGMLSEPTNKQDEIDTWLCYSWKWMGHFHKNISRWSAFIVYIMIKSQMGRNALKVCKWADTFVCFHININKCWMWKKLKHVKQLPSFGKFVTIMTRLHHCSCTEYNFTLLCYAIMAQVTFC